jgi:phospholipase/lecithinase/hemolysin
MVLMSIASRLLRAASAALAALALGASCGGGELIDPFVPSRIVTFGDETSALTAGGFNWGVNGINSTTLQFDCTINKNWVQYLASVYGIVFAECNPSGVTALATNHAVAGAKAADVTAQIDAHLATGTLGTGDLVTILAGQNDILEQYALYPATDEATITAELRARGEALAAQVNRLADLDTRVIVSTVPDVGLSPFAAAEVAAHTDTNRGALLSRLVAAFNGRLRANLVNDGRRIGLTLADEMTQAIFKFPTLYGFVNATDVVCTTAPPDCTTSTLITGGSGSAWLWSDVTHLSAGGQLRLGALAEARARNNPF